MRVQTKLMLGIFPILLGGFSALSLLSYFMATDAIRRDAYHSIDTVLAARYEHTLQDREQLLRATKMDKVTSFLRLYQNEATADLKIGSDAAKGCFAVFDTEGREVFALNECKAEPLLSELRRGALEALREQSEVSHRLIARGGPRLMGARFFAPWGWILVYSIDTGHLEEAIQRALFLNFGLAGLCVAACGLVIAFVFRRVFARPVERLKEAAARIARQEPDVVIDVKSADELGALSRSLNEMAKAIAASIASLEQLRGDLERSNKAMALEIDDRCKAQADLLDALDKLAATIRAIPDILFEVDCAGRIYDFHLPEGELLYAEAKEFLGKRVSEVLPPGASATIMSAIEQAAAHGWHRGAVYSLDSKTGTRWYELSIAAKGQGRSSEARLVASIRDITERIAAEAVRANLESQLHQAQKLESVGRLAGGVAHDFNNMLGVIIGHTELALLDAGLSAEQRDTLEQIQRVAEQSADLARQLLAFARKQTIAPKVIELNELVASTLQMIERLIGEDIHLVWNPGASLWRVKMDPSQIVQILTNLCVNSRDAIPDIGRITIETRCMTADEAFCKARAGIERGDYVLLSVSDDGMGMDADTLAHIFEPFFTTKGVGKGTGLGLATVYGIVQQNRGFIDVSSQPGQGATFVIGLPRYQGEGADALNLVQRDRRAPGNGTILLVEDEPAVLNLTSQMLGRLGYSVLSANSGAQALQLAEQHAREISLLLTDVVMPEMNGKELSAKVQSLCPNAKCLFMSGYTSDVMVGHGLEEEGMLFLQKPFNMDQLAKKLRKAIDS